MRVHRCIPFLFLYELHYIKDSMITNKRVSSATAFIVLLLAFICSSCTEGKKQRDKTGKKEAQIVFNDTIHDFGTFPTENPVRHHVFTFRNTGSIPVAIVNVHPSCGCVTVTHTMQAVRSGESGQVEVTFDGKQAAPGYFSKSVRVRINSSRVYTLKVTGTMK